MKADKKTKIFITVILVLLAIIILYVGEQFLKFHLKTKEFKKLVESGELEEYVNSPHTDKGGKTVYHGTDLNKIVGVDLRVSDTELGGQSCARYWNNRNTPTEFDDLTFYVFNKEKRAKKAFNVIKDSFFREITDEGDDYVRGWLDGVVDADVEEYYYIHGNLIVSSSVTSVDESARDINDTSPAVYGGGEEAEAIIDLIRENF